MTEITLQDRWDAMASLCQNAEAMVADGVMEGFAKTVVAGGNVTFTEEDGDIYPALGDAMIGSVVKNGRLHKLLQRALEAEKAKAKKPFRKLVALDFDGVLHSYTTPWTNAATISDGPTPGAMQFLRDLVDDERFEVCIVSSRLSQAGGTTAVADWLFTALSIEFGAKEGDRLHREIELSSKRPPAFVTIDDRAVTFLGTFPSLDRLAAFQPWNKKPRHLRPDPSISVAAIDAVMQRIGRVAKETDCPGDVPALDGLEEGARIGHQVASNAPVTLERISDEDMERIRALPLQPGAVLALPVPDDFDARAAKGYDPEDDLHLEDYQEEFLRTVERISDVAAALPGLTPAERCDQVARSILAVIDGLESMPQLDLSISAPLPEDADTFAHVAEVPFNKDLLSDKYRKGAGAGGETWLLDAEFAPYADVEAIIRDAVPAGTPISHASAGGDLGWRIGRRWMSVEGSDPTRPDLIRREAKALAAIPGVKGEKPRSDDPDLVERVLAAGRAE